MSSLRILSPAKVNLFLRILAEQSNGYHLLQSLIQPVSLFDEISLLVNEGDRVRVESKGRKIPSDGKNIAAMAANLYLRTAGIRKAVSVGIRKNIPVGAGLGGGSGNAAAVLVGLNRIFHRFSLEELVQMAALLGSDVPFFIGATTSFVEGTGTRVLPVTNFPLFHYVIIFPKKHVSTPEVYKRWSRPAPPPQKVNKTTLIEQFRTGQFPLENGLEDAVFDIFPEISRFTEIFRDMGASSVQVCGSGSSVFSVFRKKKEAGNIYDYLHTSSDFDVFCVQGTKGWHFLAD